MKELETLKEKILKFCQNKFDIFYSGPISVKENCIEWNGDNFEDFLSFAEKLGIKIIYFLKTDWMKKMNIKGKYGLFRWDFCMMASFTFLQKQRIGLWKK